MKFLISIVILITSSHAYSVQKTKVPGLKAQPKVQSSGVSNSVSSDTTVATGELSGRGPKAIFLIKRARIDSAIGEPVIYPFERQTKNLFYDLSSGVITND